jgi:ABC-type phosphate transport system permease subunit
MIKELKKTSIVFLTILGLIGLVSAQGPTQTTQATSVICGVLSSIRTVLFIIAGGIGVVVITLQGIKWAGSADDPGARKQAKEGIIHAIVGLIIVLVAVALVSMVFGGGCAMQ